VHELVWIKLNESKCTVKQWNILKTCCVEDYFLLHPVGEKGEAHIELNTLYKTNFYLCISPASPCLDRDSAQLQAICILLDKKFYHKKLLGCQSVHSRIRTFYLEKYFLTLIDSFVYQRLIAELLLVSKLRMSGTVFTLPYVPLLRCIEKPLPFIREEFLSLCSVFVDWLHME